MDKKSLVDKSDSQKIIEKSNLEDLELFREAKELFNEALSKMYPFEFSVKSVYEDMTKLNELHESHDPAVTRSARS